MHRNEHPCNDFEPCPVCGAWPGEQEDVPCKTDWMYRVLERLQRHVLKVARATRLGWQYRVWRRVYHVAIRGAARLKGRSDLLDRDLIHPVDLYTLDEHKEAK